MLEEWSDTAALRAWRDATLYRLVLRASQAERRETLARLRQHGYTDVTQADTALRQEVQELLGDQDAKDRFVGMRLGVMLEAVKTVHAALDDFYGKLTDEQKAQFEAIGPRRTALSDQPASDQSAPTHQAHVRHHHGVNVAGLIRHFIWLGR